MLYRKEILHFFTETSRDSCQTRGHHERDKLHLMNAKGSSGKTPKFLPHL